MTREEALVILDTIPTIGEQVDALEMAIEALEQSVRPKAKWLDNSDGGRVVNPFWNRYICSNCGRHSDLENYCCNCGASKVYISSTDTFRMGIHSI